LPHSLPLAFFIRLSFSRKILPIVQTKFLYQWSIDIMKTQTSSTGGFENRKIYNLIVLDESGSMEAIQRASITGFNEVVQTIKGVEKQFPEQEHFVSFLTFNGLGIKTQLFNKRVKNLKEIDEETFQPDSLTPLYDAIGFSVSKLRKEIEMQKDCHVLVTILTDGEENASSEYTGAAIRKLVGELKKQGWTFTYIGANHDVERVAFSLSITNTLKFDADEAGVKKAFETEEKARGMYARKMRLGENLQENYFEEAEKAGFDGKS